MKYITAFIIASCIVAGGSGLVRGQSPSTSSKFIMKNGAMNIIALAPPANGVTDYTLTFPPAVGGVGSLLYLNNGTGSLGWTTAGGIGQVLTIDAFGVPGWATSPTGSVTSVALTMPAVLYSSVLGSPITTSGTLAPQLSTQIANTVFAGPATGAPATPTFRGLVAADIPGGSGNYIQNGTTLQTANFNISGNGGISGQLQLMGTSTGITTFQAGAQGATNINYTLPISQGATGTVLQNDGTGALSWVDISTVIGAVKFAIKPNDETITNSTTLKNDNDLYFTIGANETWELFTQLDAITDGEDGDAPFFKVAVTIPSGTLHVFAYGDGGDDIPGDWLTTSGTANTDTFEISDENEDGPIVLQGLIACGNSGGTVHIQWAPSTSTTKTATVKKNSYLKATRAN